MTQAIYFNVKLLSENAYVPTKGSEFSAGYDLYASESSIIPSFNRATIKTDISVMFPPNYYLRIAPRSGLASKHGISVGAGVVDQDYAGELKVVLFNHSSTTFTLKKGDRIAQAILEHIITPNVTVVDDISETARGSDGFGSTGN